MKDGQGLDFLPCYAIKANYNPALLKIIHDMGFGADVVSGGEFYFALRAGFSPEKIIFAGVGKTLAKIENAVRQRIRYLNIESEQELQLAASIAQKLQEPVSTAIRVNPDITAMTHKYISTVQRQNKFGIAPETCLRIYASVQNDKWVRPRGLHVNIGSQIITREPFVRTVNFLLEFKQKLENIGLQLTCLDLGGGIRIPYGADHNHVHTSTHDYINQILPDYVGAFRQLGLNAGEYLALTGAGAYSQALFSNYNLLPRIAEYLVDNTNVTTIAEAQIIEDIAGQYEE